MKLDAIGLSWISFNAKSLYKSGLISHENIFQEQYLMDIHMKYTYSFPENSIEFIFYDAVAVLI